MSGEKTRALTRQWEMLEALSKRRFGMTLREMAAEWGVDTRTIQRDLDLFESLGFPVSVCHTSDHGAKHWRLDSEKQGLPLNFAWDEAIALYLGRRMLDPLAGTITWQSANKAFRKIKACLGERALKYLDKMSGAFHQTRFGASDYHEKSQIIDDLTVAIEDRTLTLLTYQSLNATEPVTYEIAPYGLVFHHYSLYLIAHSSDHDQVRVFKIDRVADVDRGELKFERPAGFDLKKHLADSFGIFTGGGKLTDVRVRFHPDVARVVSESQWHASQKLRRQSDGSLIAEFQLGDLHEITSWILSFGSKATVLEPASMKDNIARELRRSLEQLEATA